jgi:beta-glucosidase
VIDNWTRQRHERAFYGLFSEKKGTFQLKADTKHKIFVVFCNVLGSAGDEDESVMNMYNISLQIFSFCADRHNVSTEGVLHLGGAEIQDSDKLLEQAVDLAKDADGVIAIVGLNDDWETEGNDRTTLALPGRTDELIARVAAVNAKTVVVTQAVCCLVVKPYF